MPLQPMLADEAWRRINRVAEDGNDGAKALASFFVADSISAGVSVVSSQVNAVRSGSAASSANRTGNGVPAAGRSAANTLELLLVHCGHADSGKPGCQPNESPTGWYGKNESPTGRYGKDVPPIDPIGSSYSDVSGRAIADRRRL
ncbi:hypothetical protein [Saccharopolyspora spinosa]|uniref:hypothetical protein n=1 Tax=Saccharopolyspora spinosa TaxID=60894 RepID=UPI000237B381|nr:hypothetical protein [Saccharopolyspora spinosa]